MFQKNAFQLNAFQFAGAYTATEDYVGRSTYVPAYQRHQLEEAQRDKIRKEKNELGRLQSVLDENRRKASLAAESARIAKLKKDQERLRKLEQEYLDEITRLLMVRDELIKRAKQSEETLILMMVLKRKRLRSINWQGNHLQLVKG